MREKMTSAERRQAWILYATLFLAWAISSSAFFMSEDACRRAANFLLENNIPLAKMHADYLSKSHEDWRQRLVAIYISFLASPLVMYLSMQYGIRFLGKYLVMRSPLQDKWSKIKRIAAGVVLAPMLVIGYYFVADRDVAFYGNITKHHELLMTFIAVIESHAAGTVVGLLIVNIILFNKKQEMNS